MSMKDKKALLDKVRKKLKEQKGSQRDPNQFRVPNVKAGEPAVKFRFVVLPGLNVGDKSADGPTKAGMDDMFCVSGGVHWISGRPFGCPRLYDNEECPWCNLGFSLMSECDIPEERSKISKLYLPKSVYLANIYFPPFKVNPADMHGKVLWYPMPKTVFDKMEECFMRDDAGDDPEHDPKPYGMFYDPEDCLIFQLEVFHKNGYNTYENSKFLLNRSAIADSDEKIQAILDQRHDLFSKAHSRDVKELEKMLDKLYGDGADDNSPKEEAPPKTEEKAAPPSDDDDVLPPSKKTQKTAAPPKKDPTPEPEPTPEPAKAETPASDVDDPELQELLDDVQGDV